MEIQTSAITSLAIAREGTRMFSASAGGTLQVHDLGESVVLVRTLRATGDDRIVDIAFDGPRWLAITNRQLLCWNAALEPVTARQLEHPADRIVVRESAVFLAGESHVARIPRETDGFGTAVWTAVAAGAVTDFDVDQSGKRFVVVKADTAVHVHSAATGVRLCGWDASDRYVSFVSVRFTTKLDHLWLVANRSGKLCRVSAKTGRAVGRKESVLDAALASGWSGPVVTSFDGRYLASLQNGEDVHVWDLAEPVSIYYAEPVIDRSSAKFMASLVNVPRLRSVGPGVLKFVGGSRQPDSEARVTALAISDGAARIALGHRDGTLQVLNSASGHIEQVGRATPLAESACTATTRWNRFTAAGYRDEDAWAIVDGRIGRIDPEQPESRAGVRLEDLGDDATDDEVPYMPTLGLVDDLAILSRRHELIAWSCTTGRVAWRLQTPGPAEIVGGFAHAIDASETRGREFTIARVDLVRGEVVDRVRIAADERIALDGAPVNWPNLCSIGRHLMFQPFTRRAMDARYELAPDTYSFGSFVALPRIEPISTDGRHVAYGTPGEVAIVDLDAPDRAPVKRRVGDAEESLSRITPFLRSQRIVGWDARAYRVVVATAEGEVLHRFVGHGVAVLWFFLSRDARTLLSVDASRFVRQWRLRDQ